MAMNKDSDFGTGAVRSADTNHLDYTSLPLIGLIAVARTAAEGAAKYGRLNYMQGIPVHDLVNHSINHIVQFLLGDRTVPHLEHACWGVMAAIQSYVLDPDLSRPHLLGPGATLSPDNRGFLARHSAKLKAARDARTEQDNWDITELPEVANILLERYPEDDIPDEEPTASKPVSNVGEEWSDVVKQQLKKYMRLQDRASNLRLLRTRRWKKIQEQCPF